MNFLKKFLGSSPKGELAMIPSGQLFLKRSPGSPKSAAECLYTDAAASIRETSSPHNFLLVIQRAYAEGEEQLRGDDDDEEEDFEETKDERVFLIDKELNAHKLNRSGTWVVSWNNIDGDEGEHFEFVVEENVKSSEVDHFMNTLHACCFERKYQRSSAGITQSQLEEFIFDPEADPLDSLERGFSSLALSSSTADSKGFDEEEDDESDSIYEDANDNAESVPELKNVPSPEGKPIAIANAQLHLYDSLEGSFKFQSNVKVTVLDLGKWEYWLSIKNSDGLEFGAAVSDELNSRFESSVTSFIFNYWAGEGAFTLLLRFANDKELDNFKQGFLRAYHEHNNQSKWEKQDDAEQNYMMSAFETPSQDEEMLDYYNDFEEDEPASEEEGEEEELTGVSLRTGLHKETFSDSEDEESEKVNFKGQNKNLTVAFKNDRSYVTNGNRVGVFSTNEDDELKYATTIQNLNVKGKEFIPKKMMLHTEDRSLVMQGDQRDTLYRMDLERGQIVDEWKVRDDLQVNEFGPSSKFNQMTGEQTFLGISDKGLFKVDPRLSGDKLVESEYKSYATKNGFSSFGTTENGYIAVASTKGDVRLYDRLGIRAKALLPAIGDNIKHVEVSADGKWLLATCRTYLMLIDLTIRDGNNSGKLGFQASFGKDKLPKIRMLKIAPEHVAYMQATTKKSLDFSKAYFNTGLDVKEQTIVSSSGPYAITWSLKKILRGDAEPYLIKRYSSNVVADNFRFGSDKNVIIALEDDVGMVSKKAFRKADRNSLAFKPRTSF
jgi:hypothetical protein